MTNNSSDDVFFGDEGSFPWQFTATTAIITTSSAIKCSEEGTDDEDVS